MEERPFRKRPQSGAELAAGGRRFAKALVKATVWFVPPFIVLGLVDSGWRWPVAAVTFVAGVFVTAVADVFFPRWQVRDE